MVQNKEARFVMHHGV